jgi:hypothetical protein
LLVGAAVLLVSGALSEWCMLPRALLRLVGLVNLVYGAYALSLAWSAARPLWRIQLLAAANMAWFVVCSLVVTRFAGEASALGLAYVGGEGLYVGALGVVEWRWRAHLSGADGTR